MEYIKENDSISSYERNVIPPSTTAGVEKQERSLLINPVSVVTYGDPSLPWSGVIYRRWLDKPDCEDNGKSYIGETKDEKTRIQSWNKSKSSEYGGAKIKSARDKYGLSCWGYEVLENVYAESEEELKKLLNEREAFYIRKFNSYDNGFNGNHGGTGNTGVVFDEARRKQNGDNRRGKPQSDATKEILRRKSTGRLKSIEEKQKISVGNTGKKRTLEMRKAQSDRMKGTEPKAATAGAKVWREKNGGGSWKGKKLPKSTIAKRSATRRKTSQRIKVTSSDGSVNYYLCQTDVSKATGLPDGSISYALNHNNGLHKRTGYKFEKITDEEYRNNNVY